MDIGENGHTAQKIKPNRKYFLDTMSVKTPRANMNVQSYLKDGLIEDWDAFEKVMEYTFGKHLKCDPSKHPILVSEPVVSEIF
jgi:actin-related protein